MEIFDFGKYNLYIWASYGITFIVLALNIALPALEKKKLLKKIKRSIDLDTINENEQ